METKEFIQASLNRIRQSTARAIDGLSHRELAWTPKPDTNSIGLLLFHMARSEDMFIQERLLNQTQVWQSAKWFEKFKLPVEETGSHYTADQLLKIRVPEISNLTEYAEAVHSNTIEYLQTLNEADFDKVINMGRMGEVTIGAVFALIVVHLASHVGDISYVRGMQRGLDQ